MIICANFILSDILQNYIQKQFKNKIISNNIIALKNYIFCSFQFSFGNIMDQPNTRRSKPQENRSQFNSGSSAQATDETIRL